MLRLRDIDRLGWSMWDPSLFDMGSRERKYFYTEETDEYGYQINIELPGVKATDTEITQTENVVRIKGLRGKEKFEFTHRIPRGYDARTVTATLKDGILSLRSNEESSPPSRRIEIA